MGRTPKISTEPARGVSPAAAVASLRRLLADRVPEQERRAAELRRRLPAVVNLLVSEFGVRRVLLFGSLAAGLAHEGSDIDLAVEGLAPERYFAALSRAASEAGRDVDLVPLEEASPELRRIIEERGEVLHDQR